MAIVSGGTAAVAAALVALVTSDPNIPLLTGGGPRFDTNLTWTEMLRERERDI
jgi:hypothetical protein